MFDEEDYLHSAIDRLSSALQRNDLILTEHRHELAKLRAMLAGLCTLVVERQLLGRDELMSTLRHAINNVDELRVTGGDGASRRALAPTPSGGPYRDDSLSWLLTPGDPQVSCLRCGRFVAQTQTNVTEDGPICDTCWEPRI